MREVSEEGLQYDRKASIRKKKWKLTFTKTKDRGKLDRPKARAVIIMLRYFYCKRFLVDLAFVWICRLLGRDTIFQERFFITFFITFVQVSCRPLYL